MSHTIAQVKAFPIGTVIPSVVGTLEKVYPIKTGEGQYGPWKLQSFVFSDGEDKIKGTLFDGDDIAYLQGKTVTLLASGTNGKTKKKQGVEVVANRQDQTPELSIKSKQGGIVVGDGPNPAYLRSSAASASAPSSPSAPVSRPAPSVGSSEDAVDTLNRLAAFWLVCYVKSGNGPFPLTNELRQSMTASLFIEGNKLGLAKVWPSELVKDNVQMNEPAEAQDNPF